METNSFSIFKDASRYTSEIGLSVNITGHNITITDDICNEPIKDNLNSVAKTIKDKQITIYHNEVINSSWQGVNLAQRINDDEVKKTYFNWLKNWKTCPTSIVQEFFLMFYQLLPTKQYQIIRTQEIINDTTCRMCHQFPQESVKHLLSNCGEFVKGIYKRRHDSVLKCFVWALLYQFKLIEKQPTWYAPDNIKPYYQNENVKFWWDCPEYSGYDNEVDNPVRPDGKVQIESEGAKNIFLIEMTVPWTEIREDRYDFKTKKYENVMQNLKIEYPDFQIGQITLAIDVFGGYSKTLENNFSKVISNNKTVKNIIKDMQKAVISSLANLSRTFKIRCK